LEGNFIPYTVLKKEIATPSHPSRHLSAGT